jgi:hemerythrin
MRQGKGKLVLEGLPAEMIEYPELHFAAEQKLMTRIHYPKREAHLQRHEALRRK